MSIRNCRIWVLGAMVLGLVVATSWVIMVPDQIPSATTYAVQVRK